MRTLRLPLIALALVVLALVLLAGACGGDEEAASSTTSSTSTSSTSTSTTTTLPPTTTTEAVGPTSMLNGAPLEIGADQDRRVVAMKIDNHPDARPQSGLQEAESVVEILVEGGITRFIALFHGTDSEYVGPIRSGRPTDPTMVAPLGATLQISGGQAWIQSIISGAGVPYLTEAESSTFRIPADGRAYERTLYGSTLGVREVADARGFPDEPPAQPWFEFGEPRRSTTTAETVTLSWDGNWPDVNWVWDGERYLRFNGEEPHGWVDVEGNGEQIAAETLLVLKVNEYSSCPSGSGSCVPAAETTGTGEALLFFDGSVVEGTWEREEITDFFTLTRADGRPMVLPAGYLWVSVFPDEQPVTWE
ncbi:MAG: DUF3048 domain-containing protein [Acidimicrobiia bacterium]